MSYVYIFWLKQYLVCHSIIESYVSFHLVNLPDKKPNSSSPAEYSNSGVPYEVWSRKALFILTATQSYFMNKITF